MFAYRNPEPTRCRLCLKHHYYLSVDHQVITGSYDELARAKLPFDIVPYDEQLNDVGYTAGLNALLSPSESEVTA